MKDQLESLTKIYREFGEFCQGRGRVSEADTRATIIDRLLHTVLGWSIPSVSREAHAAPGYVDYQLTTTRPVIIVEAKAVGESFVVPHSKSTLATRLKINGVLRSNAPLQEALAQAQRYCSDRGIRYAVVSNGYSFVIFRAIIEGAPWRDGEAIVFQSPKTLEADFRTFWGLLSYDSVSAGKLDDAFRASGASPRGYHRPISRVINADATYDRNPINTALRPFVDKYFGDIAAQDQVEILEHCYVHSRPLQIIDKDLQMIIHDRIPRFAANAVEILTDEEDQGGAIERQLRTVLDAASRSGMVALLMGGIGAGKTTFLKRFFSFIIPDLVGPAGPAVLAHLDFLGAPHPLNQLDLFLWHNLATILRSQDSVLTTRPALEEMCGDKLRLIRETYGSGAEAQKQIADALFNLGTDPEAFSQQVLHFYLRRGRMPIVVFDNVDQLGIDTQTHIFTTAERFANHYGCVAILVMREESYCVAQLRKQLTAYTIRPYHLSSPGFSDMIRARLDFATSRAAEMRDLKTGSAGARQRAREILDFFSLLRRSIFHRNKNIARLIEAVSFGNMRIALDLFNNFIISGATNTPEILHRFRSSGGYSVPFHQFAKSVVLGDYRYYKESRSLIFNVFDVTECRNAGHFTTLRVLRFCAGNFGAKKTAEGFIDLQTLINAMVDTFDNEEDVVRTIRKLIEIGRQLLELDTRRGDSLEGASTIRITSAGQYYLYYLVRSFAYLDLVWQDTPLDSAPTADSLARLMPEVEMRTRFRRVETVLDYLSAQEDEELSDRSLPRSGNFFYGPFMSGIRKQYEHEKEFITTRFARDGKSI